MSFYSAKPAFEMTLFPIRVAEHLIQLYMGYIYMFFIGYHKLMAQPSSSKSKTIKPPGSSTVRVSVACDRCRKKKIRCFYDDSNNNQVQQGQCANCKAVGLECIFTDKLARKAFPRGYTESLEERVRELEYENKKLQKLITLNSNDNNKDGISIPMEITMSDNSINNDINNNNNNNISNNNINTFSKIRNNLSDNDNSNDTTNLNQNQLNSLNDNNQSSDNLSHSHLNNPNLRDTSNFQLHSANVSRLDIQEKSLDLHQHDENCNCGMDHSVINRPVSIAGSVDIDRGDLTDDDDEIDNIINNRSRQNSIFHLNSPYNSPFSDSNDTNNMNMNMNNNMNINNQINPFSKNNESKNNNENTTIKNRFVYNPNSFEQINAPGAAAAVSLQNKLRTKNFLNLANLIAASIPRSTEETLFIPTLLARIIKTHGFDSKAPYLTARSIALLKQAHNENERYNLLPILFQGIDFNNLKKEESKNFFNTLNLPNNMNLDICITIFFNTWNTIIPILNKDIFMTNYKKFTKSRENNFDDGEMIGFEKFGELLVIITCLVMISTERANVAFKISKNKENNNNNNNNNNNENDNDINNDSIKSGNYEILHFYDHIIKQLIKSNMSSIGSISSLQIITIELLYCLATEDLTTSYSLRGKMITMSQQLRLHRCPAAVLGSNGSSVSKLQQGERRILFWCIYTLDSFSAFILGVPRLFKDYEIECALPASSNTTTNSSSNEINLITFKDNIQLSLFGKVSDSALSIMRYSKILGTIVDSIFKRNEGDKQTIMNENKCLIMENLLDSWRMNLPKSISIDKVYNSKDLNLLDNLNEIQLTLYYLYYQAKALIYMPLLANESGNNSNNNNNNNNTTDNTGNKFSPAFISIQKASTSILTTMKILNSSKHNYYFLPLPINLSRQIARFSLLAAKNSLEYTRGGSIFQEVKNLLNGIIYELQIQNKIGLLGCLSDSCISCLENAIEAILSQPKSNNNSVSPNGSNNGTTPVAPIVKKIDNKVKINNEIHNEIIENLKFENKKVNGGSPLKNVSNFDNMNNNLNMNMKSKVKRERDDDDKGIKKEIAINDIFSNNKNKNKNNSSNGVVDKWVSNDNDKSIKREEFNDNNIDTDIFKFMSEDPKEMEEESLNNILKNDNDNDNIERQKLLIEKKQQFLQTQQDNLERQIELLKGQSKVSDSNSLSGFNLNAMLNINDININDINTNDMNIYDNKSFTDLLMMNDFGVDASLGMPLIDFEFDNSSNNNSTKRQKTVSNNGDYEYDTNRVDKVERSRSESPSLFSWNV